LFLACSCQPAAAVEEGRKPLWTACVDGAAKGQCSIPRGLAADPVSGHVYVVDQENQRIQEFTAWGEFVKAWGAGVADGSSQQLQVCTTTCFPGQKGSGPGAFDWPEGIAIDSAGNVYVTDHNNLRVQKFSPAGQFLLMFGGGVNQGPLHPGNVCTATNITEGDTCGSGAAGSGPGQFADLAFGDSIDIDGSNTVYVGDPDRIQKFNSAGVIQSQIPLPESGLPRAVNVDGSGNLYFAYNQDYSPQFPQKPNVYKLSAATGAILGKFFVDFPLALASDADGKLYIAAEERTPRRGEVLVYDAAGLLVQKFGKGEGFGFPAGLATNTVTAAGGVGVYVANSVFGKSFVRGYYPPPDKWPPPLIPPDIDDQYALAVGTQQAVVRASIDPNFWVNTSYYVEYGTSDCKTNPCDTQPIAPGAQLGAGLVQEPVTTAGVTLSGLQPDTTYFYRFVSLSGGGGPVKGKGGKVGLDGTSGTFTTRPLPSPANTSCANQALRSGASSYLSDCRAYEMVTPVDKEDADVIVTNNNNNNLASLNQAAAAGEALTYSSYRAFGDAQSAPYVSQYIARRDPVAGWGSHGITPPRNGPSVYLGGEAAGLDVQYKAFSPELDQGWILYDGDLSLGAGSIPGYGNLYRRDNLTAACEAITRVTPPQLKPADFIPELQGVSADGGHVVFTASDSLTPNAPLTAIRQLYDFHNGKLDLVSVLPGETPNTIGSSAGTANSQLLEGRTNSVARAVSEDGSRIFWTAFTGNAGTGPLYVRIEAKETLLISSAAAQFWTASVDGSKAVFTNGGDLKVFDVEAKTTQTIAGGVAGVLGASDDVGRIYFVSTQALAGGAVAGNQNLYLYEEGAPMTFIAALSAADATANTPQKVPSPVNLMPIKHTAAVTPDGAHVAFTSTASLTGYDNTDSGSGQAAAEVFLYDADPADLRCVSCTPTGARPAARNVASGTNFFRMAGRIPGWPSQLYAPRLLAADGSRLFFESSDPLAPHDTNGRFDVYEWELDGVGDCDETDSTFSAEAGGCVNLLSGGDNSKDSELVDASSDGDDVFISTASRLLPQDPGLIDVYDARTGGGFAPAAPPASGCEGEACQGAVPAPPADSAPSSSTFNGPGNLPKQAKPKHKPKHKKKQKKGKHGKKKQGGNSTRGRG